MRTAVLGYRGSRLRRVSLPAIAGLSQLVATAGLTVDGSNNVTAWADQSGLTDGGVAGTNAPKIGADSLGRPVVQFFTEATAANSDSMNVATTTTFNAQAVSMFVVARLPVAGNSTIASLQNYSGGAAHLRFSAAAGTPQTLYAVTRNSAITAHMEPAVLSLVSGATATVGLDTDLVSGLAAVAADADCLGMSLGHTGGFNFQAMDVYEVVYAPRALTSEEAAEIRAYLAAKYRTRTAPWTKNIVYVGDSITQGTGTVLHRGYPSMVSGTTTNKWRQTNLGVSGATVASITTAAAATDGYKRTGARNVLLMQIGRNDLAASTGQQIYDGIVAYMQARIAAGWEVWVGTLIASTGTGYQAKIDEANSLLRAGIVAAGANRLIDFAALPEFDTLADAGSSTYYQGDGTHPTAAGAKLMADLVAPELADPVPIYARPESVGPRIPLTPATLNGTNRVQSTSDGQIISGLDVPVGANIQINHNNVTVRDCRVRCDGGYYNVQVNAGVTGTIVEYCELGATTPQQYLLPVGGSGHIGTIRGCNIYHTVDGGRGGTGLLFEDNWVHDLHPVQLAGDITHNDGWQASNGSGMIVRRNRIEMGANGANAAVFCKGDQSVVNDVLIEDNYLDGGGYTLYISQNGLGVTNVVARRNTFGPNYGYGRLGPLTNVTLEGNVDYLGQPVT